MGNFFFILNLSQRWALISSHYISSPYISSHSLRPMLTLSRSLRPSSFRPKFILSHNHFVPYISSPYILSQTHFVPSSFRPILYVHRTTVGSLLISYILLYATIFFIYYIKNTKEDIIT
jgi:hypothetical protein